MTTQPSPSKEQDRSHCRRTTPALSTRNVTWWSQVYGARYRLEATPKSQQPHHVQALYEAIRDNHCAALERLVQQQPHAAFAKVRALVCRVIRGDTELVVAAPRSA